MSFWKKIVIGGLTIATFGLAADAQAICCGVGHVPGIDLGDGRDSQISGQLICTDCSLDQIRIAGLTNKPGVPPGEFYEFRHRGGQVIVYIIWSDDDSERSRDGWRNISGIQRRVWLRAPSDVLQQLTAEENMLKPFIFTGSLRKSRTLDIGGVTIDGVGSFGHFAPGDRDPELVQQVREEVQLPFGESEQLALKAVKNERLTMKK